MHERDLGGPRGDAPDDASRAPLDDPARLHLLAETGLLVASAAARLPTLDRVARLAARALRTPVAQVNLITADAQIPAAAFVDAALAGPAGASLDASDAALGGAWRTPVALDGAYCQYAVQTGAPVVVEDAAADPRVCDRRATTEAGIRAYASVPLVTPTGAVLGTVCAVDFRPRQWAPADVAALEECAALAGEEVAARLGAAHALRETERRLQIARNDARQASADREQLLAEIAAERERLRAVVLHMPSPLALLVGPTHRFELVNDAFKRVSGGGGRDVTGLTPPEAFPELAGSGLFEIHDRVYATGEAWDGPETLVRYDRDGTGVRDTWFHLRFGPVRDAAGQVWAILNFAVDVTDQVLARRAVEGLLSASERARVEAEMANAQLQEQAVELEAQTEALQATALELETRTVEREASLAAERAARAEAEDARAQSEAVLGSIADAFYLLDRDWRFTYVNAAAEPLLQTTRAQLLGRTLWEAFPGVSGSVFEGPYREAMTTGRVTSAEAFFEPLDTWFDVRSYPWTGGLMVHFRDISARKAAEAERERLLADAETARFEAEEARSAAEEANRAKSEFLAVMSHELRTPLNAIGGYAELLELGIRGPITPEQREDLRRVQASQRHLLGLINEVLNYAKLETGAVDFHPSDVSLRQALAEAEALVAPQAQAKGLTLTVELCPSELVARADAEKLRQVLVNLASNAVKFTGERDGQPGRVDLSCAADGARVAVRVRDTGIGIPADKLEVIFDPFVQVRADLTRTAEGTGLGLAISRDLARGMGGDLTVASTVGEGSTFTLTLPRAETAGARPAADDPSERADPRPES